MSPERSVIYVSERTLAYKGYLIAVRRECDPCGMTSGTISIDAEGDCHGFRVSRDETRGTKDPQPQQELLATASAFLFSEARV